MVNRKERFSEKGNDFRKLFSMAFMTEPGSLRCIGWEVMGKAAHARGALVVSGSQAVGPSLVKGPGCVEGQIFCL